MNIFMKARYNARYLLLNLEIENKVFLKLYHEYLILDLDNRKLTQQRIELFKIITKIN